jgi:hypothetical protein
VSARPPFTVSPPSPPPPVTAARGRPFGGLPDVGPAYPPAVVIAITAITAITLLAAFASALDPALGPGGHPHPTLHGTPREALGIFETNARLLAVPLLLVAGRWPAGRFTRHLGDGLVGALLIVNPVTIGFALGRFPITLLPYLPHLPVEDAALATAVGAWLSRRLPRPPGRSARGVLRYAVWTFALTALAALIETYLVPHAS